MASGPQITPGIGLQGTKKTIKTLKFPVLSEKYGIRINVQKLPY
jgi:hypothetical protein